MESWGLSHYLPTSEAGTDRTVIFVNKSESSILRKQVALPCIQLGEVVPSEWRRRRLSR